MKKYFMTGTDDELQFGDMVELDFTKDTKRGTVHHHMEIKFLPELVKMLLDEEVIEEREVKEEPKDLEEFEDREFDIEAFEEDFEALEEKVEALEAHTDLLQKQINNVIRSLESACEINNKVLAKLDSLEKTAKTSKKK